MVAKNANVIAVLLATMLLGVSDRLCRNFIE